MLQALRIQVEEDVQSSSLSELMLGVEWEKSMKSVNQEKYQQKTEID